MELGWGVPECPALVEMGVGGWDARIWDKSGVEKILGWAVRGPRKGVMGPWGL